MNKAVVTIIIILLIVLIGVGSVIIVMLKPSKSEAGANIGYVYDTEKIFLTNLRTSKHYVKAGIQIEVSDKKTLRLMEKCDYKIRDRIIGILGEIQEENTKEKDFLENLKNTMKDELQKTLKTDKIKGVYLSEFIVQ